MARSIIRELARIVGRENVLFSKKDLLAYSYDATQRQEMPEVIVFPSTTSEISEVVQAARRKGVPIVPRGAGTGITGGTVAIKGGVVLELSRMNRIIALDTDNQRAVVEPGTVNLDLQDALAPLGFIYPPDPASQKSCTLGGNIGENAGGPLCFRYGVTSKYVSGMEVVLPTGEIVDFGGTVEDFPGYDLRGLLIGSEGTLGVATKLTLRIVPAPEASSTMLAVFDTLEDAGQAVSDIVSAGIVPAALELMDKRMCWAIEESIHAGYPVDAEGVLLIEVAGLANGLDRQVKDITEICQRNKVRELRRATTSAERDALWKGRKGAFGSVARICPNYMVNDGAVPRNRLMPALRKVGEIAEKHHVVIANVAHAGDGNLHPLIVFDASKPDEVAAAKIAGEEILDTCIALDGTISGEHGIGLEKLAAMPRMFSRADLATMRRVKQILDPDNILNPAKLIPVGADVTTKDESSRPIEKSTRERRQALAQRFAEIVGAENVITGDPIAASYEVDELMPGAVVFPSTTEQVSQIVKAGNQYQTSIVPWGTGSKQGHGRCLSAADVILCTTRMKRTIDLDVGNSTLRVEAGEVNDELQKGLAKHRLFFPLAPIFTETSTIGGELATNASGPLRLMYGTARDLILGLTVVTPTGDIIRPGGKTMKNVAGLDLCKLFIGSWGTLGIITEAVLRLYPLAEVSKSLCLVFACPEDALRVAGQLIGSRLSPRAIELIDPVASRHLAGDYTLRPKEGGVMLMVGIEGTSEVVDRHVKEISEISEANNVSTKITVDGDKSEKLWSAYRGMHQSLLEKVQSGLKGKASVPISKLTDMFRATKGVGDKHKVEIGLTAHCGNGILYVYFSGEKEDALRMVDDIRKAAERLGGFFMIESAPSWVRKDAGVWPRPGAYSIMERLKTGLDPNNVLNPGKLVGA